MMINGSWFYSICICSIFHDKMLKESEYEVETGCNIWRQLSEEVWLLKVIKEILASALTYKECISYRTHPNEESENQCLCVNHLKLKSCRANPHTESEYKGKLRNSQCDPLTCSTMQ